MFIIAPLLFILVSIAVIAIIIWRKVPYLKKLTPEAHEFEDNLFYDFFPELADWVRKFDYREHQNLFLSEIEKAVRKLRLLVLKIDHTSGRLINKLRSWSDNGDKSGPKIEMELEKIKAADSKKDEKLSPNHEMKKEEQRLIIEIAKNPKEFSNYVELGDLYVKMGSQRDAKESYETALKLQPENPAIMSKLSQLDNTV